MDLDADVCVSSVEGDFLQRATRVADAIRRSGIEVVFVHGSLSELITARVAAMRPAPVLINVNHGSEMDADLFDGFIHLFQNSMERTRFRSHPSEWIPLTSDIEARLQKCEPVTRQGMGLQSAGSVSATFGNLQQVSGSGYVRVVIEILHRFPNHFHLFAGAGNIRAMRSVLHAEGVLPRVRFLGQISDVAPMLGSIDIYLAPFPESAVHSVIEAMGAGKPIVVLRQPPDSDQNFGAELVGIEELIARSEGDYIEIADRLLRNPAVLARYSLAVKDRFRKQFRPEHLAERYISFANRLISAIESRRKPPAGKSTKAAKKKKTATTRRKNLADPKRKKTATSKSRKSRLVR
jgi:predicted O-linked N-acetylglucosamine transferase (SPINDLY family)